MKKLLSLFAFLVFFVGTITAQNPVSKPLTHEIMVKLKKVGAPQISPDGKWVIYSQGESSYVVEDNSSDLWLASTDGQVAPRRLTSSKGGEDGYFWHPKGDKIYFSAKRDGDEVPQLYVLSLQGGEAQRLTTLSTGVSGAKISDDGKYIAFTSRVFPTAYHTHKAGHGQPRKTVGDQKIQLFIVHKPSPPYPFLITLSCRRATK